jgi:signal transduction histidine kinase
MEKLEQVIKELRSYVLSLKPEDDAASLPEALAALLEQTRAHALLETELHVHGLDSVDIPLPVAKAMIHIAREAITNVARHARAGCIWIKLQASAGFVELEITDNGSGFDTGAVRLLEHHGLSDMHERALALGGRVTMQSEPGSGATVRARVPLATGGVEAGSV